ALWRELIFTSGKDIEILGKVVDECQTWWNNNCLYLEPKARRAFFDAYMSAPHRPILLKSNDKSAIVDNWEKITKAGEIIVSGVALPTIGENESEFVKTGK